MTTRRPAQENLSIRRIHAVISHVRENLNHDLSLETLVWGWEAGPGRNQNSPLLSNTLAGLLSQKPESGHNTTNLPSLNPIASLNAIKLAQLRKENTKWALYLGLW